MSCCYGVYWQYFCLVTCFFVRVFTCTSTCTKTFMWMWMLTFDAKIYMYMYVFSIPIILLLISILLTKTKLCQQRVALWRPPPVPRPSEFCLRHGFMPTARFVLSHGALLSLMLLGKYLVLAAESIWSKERRALFMYMYVNMYIFAVGYYKWRSAIHVHVCCSLSN